MVPREQEQRTELTPRGVCISSIPPCLLRSPCPVRHSPLCAQDSHRSKIRRCHWPDSEVIASTHSEGQELKAAPWNQPWPESRAASKAETRRSSSVSEPRKEKRDPEQLFHGTRRCRQVSSTTQNICADSLSPHLRTIFTWASGRPWRSGASTLRRGMAIKSLTSPTAGTSDAAWWCFAERTRPMSFK